MVPRSPDPSDAGPGNDGALGSDGAGRQKAEQLQELRSAVAEIDQRHAEGESFFGDTLGRTPDRGDDGAQKAARTPAARSPRRKPAAPAEPNPFDGDLSDAPAFALGDDDSTPDWIVALAADTNEDSSFEDDEVEEPDFDESYAKAKKTAMNMLAMRDHSRDELRKKLLGRDYLEDAVELLLDKLERSKLLNDEEFAQHFARAQRDRRKLSRGALKRELKKKGIAQEIIAETVENVDGEEELARAVAEKKARSTRGLDRQVRERRILGMLARRGFASSICIAVTKDVLADE